jgi:hypothetical protein
MSVASTHSDDNASTQSSKSLSLERKGCPYCSWNKQSRYLFKHISDLHPDQIYGALGDAKRIKEGLEDNSLLHLYTSYDYYKEDDEFKEFPETGTLDVYGCCACHTAFKTKSRAVAHWKKNTQCHRDHTKIVKRHLVEVEKREKDEEGKAWLNDLNEEEVTNAIERFRRWHYRIITLDIPILTKQSANIGFTLPLKYREIKFIDPLQEKNKIKKFELYKQYATLMHSMNIYLGRKMTIDYKLPSHIGFGKDWLNDGLQPVGSSYDRNPLDEKINERKQIEQEVYSKQDEVLREKLRGEILKELQKAKIIPTENKEEKKLEPILEEPPKKEKRNSFTIPIPTPGSLVSHSVPAAQFPTIILDTKKKREVKRAPSLN